MYTNRQEFIENATAWYELDEVDNYYGLGVFSDKYIVDCDTWRCEAQEYFWDYTDNAGSIEDVHDMIHQYIDMEGHDYYCTEWGTFDSGSIIDDNYDLFDEVKDEIIIRMDDGCLWDEEECEVMEVEEEDVIETIEDFEICQLI